MVLICATGVADDQALHPDSTLLRTDTLNAGSPVKITTEIISLDSVLQNDRVAEFGIHDSHEKKINWVIPIYLLGLLFYITFLKLQYSRQLSENITVVTNMNLAQQIYRDREFSAGIFSVLILLNFILVLAILFYLYLNSLHFNYFSGNIVVDIAACGLIVPAIYFVRSVVYWCIALIFPFKTEINFFRFNTRVLLQLAGIALLPLAILSATTASPLSDWALYFAVGLLILVYVVRIWKGISIGAGFARFHFFYFLLYLCAFEIAPLLIIIKLINTWGINS